MGLIKMKVDLWAALTEEIKEYFGIESWYPLEDCRDRHWLVTDPGEMSFSDGDIDYEDEGDLMYSYDNVRQVYRKKDLTAILVYDSGEKYIAIFDNAKEVK